MVNGMRRGPSAEQRTALGRRPVLGPLQTWRWGRPMFLLALDTSLGLDRTSFLYPVWQAAVGVRLAMALRS